MAQQKKLQNESEYNKYDLDGDGVVTDEELSKMKEIELLKCKKIKLMLKGVWLGSLWLL
jgi:hypothetical protein